MLRQTTPSSPLSHGLVPPSKPVLGSGGSGRVLGTFRPHVLPVFSSPSSGAAWGGRSGSWCHLRTLPSPARALIPLPSRGRVQPFHHTCPAAGPACERRLLLQDAYGSSLALAHPSSGPVAPSQAPGCPQTHTRERSGPAGSRAPHCPGICGHRPLQSGHPSDLAAAGLHLVSWGRCEGGAGAQTLLPLPPGKCRPCCPSKSVAEREARWSDLSGPRGAAAPGTGGPVKLLQGGPGQ